MECMKFMECIKLKINNILDIIELPYYEVIKFYRVNYQVGLSKLNFLRWSIFLVIRLVIIRNYKYLTWKQRILLKRFNQIIMCLLVGLLVDIY